MSKRQDTVKRVYSAIADIQSGDESGATLRDIAAYVGMAKSPYLSGIVAELVMSGVVVSYLDESVYPSRWRFYVSEA